MAKTAVTSTEGHTMKTNQMTSTYYGTGSPFKDAILRGVVSGVGMLTTF